MKECLVLQLVILSFLYSPCLSLRHSELWQLPRCSATKWIYSRSSLGLAMQTCHHHSPSSPKLPITSWAHPHLPQGTMTCPPLHCALLHAALTPTASHFSPVSETPKMPHDFMTYGCSEKFFPICMYLSVCQYPELYGKDKVNLSTPVPMGSQ